VIGGKSVELQRCLFFFFFFFLLPFLSKVAEGITLHVEDLGCCAESESAEIQMELRTT